MKIFSLRSLYFFLLLNDIFTIKSHPYTQNALQNSKKGPEVNGFHNFEPIIQKMIETIFFEDHFTIQFKYKITDSSDIIPSEENPCLASDLKCLQDWLHNVERSQLINNQVDVISESTTESARVKRELITIALITIGALVVTAIGMGIAALTKEAILESKFNELRDGSENMKKDQQVLRADLEDFKNQTTKDVNDINKNFGTLKISLETVMALIGNVTNRINKHAITEATDNIIQFQRREVNQWLEQCDHGHLPGFVTSMSFSTELENAESAINKSGMEISTRDFSTLSKSKLSTCSLKNNIFYVKFKVPVYFKSRPVTGFKLTPIVFSHRGSAYTVFENEMSVAFSDNGHFILEKTPECPLGENKLCQLNAYEKKNHASDKCIEALRPSNKNRISDLMSHCKLQMVDGNSLSVQKLDETLYIVSHATTVVQVCNEKTKVLDISKQFSLKVNRTCGCFVNINKGERILPPPLNCLGSHEEHSLDIYGLYPHWNISEVLSSISASNYNDVVPELITIQNSTQTVNWMSQWRDVYIPSRIESNSTWVMILGIGFVVLLLAVIILAIVLICICKNNR